MDLEAEQRSSEAVRLERLWAGDFGRDYTDRNDEAGDGRGDFWADLLARYPVRSVLEIGCNVGANLRWIIQHVDGGDVYGVDVNEIALRRLRERLPSTNAVKASGRDLPFRDRWFDLVFTTGVLIHQPDSTLPLVMSEAVRVSRRYVLCGEYHADHPVEVPYRGHRGALFRRDYGRMYADLFPELRFVETGYLPTSTGWDDVTWWLFERQ